MTRIFVLDDHLAMRVRVARLLQQAGYEIRHSGSGAALFQSLSDWPPDLAILDIQLTKEDGRSIVRRLRLVSSMPVLMLTARTDLQTKVQSFDLGVDDYLCKPFANEELLARIRALLRRAAHTAPAYARHPNLLLDCELRTLTIAGVGALQLTEAECQLIDMLLAHVGKSVSRETLCNAVSRRSWSPGERSLDVHISNLRRKLEQSTQHLVEIQSMRGVGYRLMIREKPNTAQSEPVAKIH